MNGNFCLVRLAIFSAQAEIQMNNFLLDLQNPIKILSELLRTLLEIQILNGLYCAYLNLVEIGAIEPIHNYLSMHDSLILRRG